MVFCDWLLVQRDVGETRSRASPPLLMDERSVVGLFLSQPAIRVGCFRPLVIMHSAALNICARAVVWTCLHFSHRDIYVGRLSRREFEQTKDREPWRAAVHGVTESDVTSRLKVHERCLRHSRVVCAYDQAAFSPHSQACGSVGVWMDLAPSVLPGLTCSGLSSGLAWQRLLGTQRRCHGGRRAGH